MALHLAISYYYGDLLVTAQLENDSAVTNLLNNTVLNFILTKTSSLGLVAKMRIQSK